MMPRRGSPYGPAYQRVRRAQLGQPCELRLVCDGTPGTSSDHDPPLARHTHVEGSGCCILRPACMPCQHRQRALLAGQTARFKALGLPVPMIPTPPRAESPPPSRAWA